MAQLPLLMFYPLRVGNFLTANTWLRCLALWKGRCFRNLATVDFVCLQLETWFGPLHQSHSCDHLILSHVEPYSTIIWPTLNIDFGWKTSPASQPNSRLQASKLPAVRFRSSFWARQRDLTPRPMGQPNYPTVTAVGNPLKTLQPIDPIALVHPPGNGSGLGKCCGSKRTGRKSSRRTPWRDAHGITEQRIRPTISRGFIKMLCVPCVPWCFSHWVKSSMFGQTSSEWKGEAPMFWWWIILIPIDPNMAVSENGVCLQIALLDVNRETWWYTSGFWGYPVSYVQTNPYWDIYILGLKDRSSRHPQTHPRPWNKPGLES